MIRILIVEDDPDMNRTLCTYLHRNGYETEGCLSAAEAYDAIYGSSFDMIISDIMMPDIDGFEMVESIRRIDQMIPILFVTARDDLEAKRMGFRIGIDDYMTKPIDLQELVMRIEAIARRAKISAEKKIQIGSLILDQDERAAYVDSEEIPLTAREFNILFKLLSYPRKTFTRSQLMEEFWDADSDSGPRVVDVYITKIRDKMSACHDFEIVTVHGMGYKAVLR